MKKPLLPQKISSIAYFLLGLCLSYLLISCIEYPEKFIEGFVDGFLFRF